MGVVTTIEEIKDNLNLFESYLCDGSESEQKFSYELIRRGRCFIAYKIADEMRFAPSRYIGYSENTMQKHNANSTKDGKETNPAIDRVIGSKLSQNDALESEYLTFISNLGIEPSKVKRKYWLLNIEGADFLNNTSSNEFPEGRMVERKHKSRERNSRLISEVKDKFFQEHRKLYCMVCGFDFEDKYGERGRGYIEAHHTIPVSEMSLGQNTKAEDIALVCSNCHRILHRSRPWLTIDNLKDLLLK